MKSIRKSIALTLILLVFLTSSRALIFADLDNILNDNNSLKVEEEHFIQLYNNRMPTSLQRNSSTTEFHIVFDASLQPSFNLLLFSEGGYALVDSISEDIVIFDQYFVPDMLKSISDKLLVMLSPTSFAILYNNEVQSIFGDYTFSKSELDQYASAQTQIRIQILDANKALKDQTDSKVLAAILTQQSTTIPQSRMYRYSGSGGSSTLWINNATNNAKFPNASPKGLCGTYSAGALLAYYDDYVSNSVVPDSIRTRYSLSPEKLLTTLYYSIDYGRNGTLPNHVSSGINTYFSDYSISNYSSSYWLLGTWSRVVASIDRARPIIVGMVDKPESKYGNHFVLGYSYLTTSTGLNYYVCIDNHGSYTANISVPWTIGTVSLNN